MVYRGKPSTACELCRKKRRKCDEKRPGCGQCARAFVLCPGYRDVSRLVIYNQTKDVIRKAEVSNMEPSGSNQATSSLDSTPSSARRSFSTSSASTLPIPHHLSVSLNNVAVTYFLSTYATSGQFCYVPSFISSDIVLKATSLSETPGSGQTDNPLPLALLSCSLATLSLTPTFSSPIIRPTAYKAYAVALSATNAALSSPIASILDNTLMSVLLLGLFEAVLFRGRASPTSWTAHTHGALALLKLRGVAQCRTPLGRELFLHAANNIRTSCAQRGVFVPEELGQLQERAVAEGWLDEQSDLSVRIGEAIEKVGRLRIKIASLGDFAATRARSAIEKVVELDEEVMGIIRDLENGTRTQISDGKAQGQVPPYAKPHGVDGGSRYTWTNPRAARTWIVLQLMRLIFNSWAYKCLKMSTQCICGGNGSETGLDYDTDHAGCLTEDQEQVVLELVSSHGNEALQAIIGTTVFCMGSPDNKQPRPSLRYLIWPLSVVAVSPFADQSIQDFAVEQLRGIGCNFGLEQADQAVRMVKDVRDIEDWYARFSYATPSFRLYFAVR